MKNGLANGRALWCYVTYRYPVVSTDASSSSSSSGVGWQCPTCTFKNSGDRSKRGACRMCGSVTESGGSGANSASPADRAKGTLQRRESQYIEVSAENR